MNRGNQSGSRRDRDSDPRQRNYRDMPAVTNRQWNDASKGNDAYSYGYEGQGGYGDFTQGGYGEEQGRHAQSGHGRGGSDFVRDEPRSAGTSHRGRGPRNYTRSDESIVDELIDRLTDDERIDATEILVMVEGGVVTLSGEVPERRMKHLAEDIADDIRGVRDIENRIRVDNGSSSFGPAGRGVRSGENQVGSGFSSSGRVSSPVSDDAVRVGRAGTESGAPERHQANVEAGPSGERSADPSAGTGNRSKK
jgi:osmotically-inducible protein OsmY